MLQSRPYVRDETVPDDAVCEGVDVDLFLELGFAQPVSVPSFSIHEHPAREV